MPAHYARALGDIYVPDQNEDGVPTSFIFELVERASDRFLNRLDALDTILIGLLAAILAIGGLAADKYEDMGAGLVWFGVAFVISVVGLSFGNLFGRPRDAPNPLRAMIGLTAEGEDALATLIGELARNWQANQPLRLIKTATAALSLTLLTVGSLAAVYERVVEYNHGTGRLSGAQRQQHQVGRGGEAPPERVRHF